DPLIVAEIAQGLHRIDRIADELAVGLVGLDGLIEEGPSPAIGKEGEGDERRAIDEDDEDDLEIDRRTEHEEREDDLDDARDQDDQPELHQRVDRVLPARLGRLDLGGIVLDEKADGLLEQLFEERRYGD